MDILERMGKYSDLGSWAIWESNNNNNLFTKEGDLNEEINFKTYIKELQPSNYVILAMNPGGIFDEEQAKKATRKSSSNSRKWSNFHNNGKSRDYLLAAAIMDTKLKGSYMTDLFPFIGSDSKVIEKFVKNPNNNDIVRRIVEEFDKEMSCLLPDQNEVILICLGKNVESWAKKYLVQNVQNFELQKKYEAYYFQHYSQSNCKNVSSNPDDSRYYPIVFRNQINTYRKKYRLDL